MARLLSLALSLMFLTPATLAPAQDAAKGKQVYEMCLACHIAGGPGPGLEGVIGRKAGAVEGFVYSEALAKANENGLIWTDENLSKFLTDPQAYLPENKMAFGAVTDPQERADLIAYLKTLSQ